MNHDKKATQESSPAETTTHRGTSDVFSDKEQKDIANNIIQLAKSVKIDANEVAVSSILPRKDKFNNKKPFFKVYEPPFITYLAASGTKQETTK